MKEVNPIVFDVGIYENLDPELPKITQLKGNTKILAKVLGVRAALHVAEIFKDKKINFNDASMWLQKLKVDRLRRDHVRHGFQVDDLADKYSIERDCVVRILGGCRISSLCGSCPSRLACKRPACKGGANATGKQKRTR